MAAANTGWAEFLKSAEDFDLSGTFDDPERPAITVGRNAHDTDIVLSLENNTPDNPLGEYRSCIVELVRDLTDDLLEPVSGRIGNLNDLFRRFRLVVDDASPDSVIGVILFAAKCARVAIPDEIWKLWLPPVRLWEQSGNADYPERSWPALASALAHLQFNERTVEHASSGALERAWKAVVKFALEAMAAGSDPADISEQQTGKWLGRARSALLGELAYYRRQLLFCDTHLLLLPLAGSDRKRLIDVLFTKEREFSGTFKIFARNDRAGTSLGQGFGLLIVERAGIRSSQPASWMTISVDPRAGVHLRDLWVELERLETEAWKEAELERPAFRSGTSDDSRRFSWLSDDEHRYHEQWYIDESFGLIGSPRAVAVPPRAGDGDRTAVGSLLSTDDVMVAIFKVYDPLQHCPVKPDQQSEPCSLLDVPPQPIGAGNATMSRRLIVASWSNDSPLPRDGGKDAVKAGIGETVLRAMAAHTLGLRRHRALVDAPDLEDIRTTAFGPGLAVITNGGIYLLDSGRTRGAKLGEAANLAKKQIALAERLDAMQQTLRDLAMRLDADTQSRISIGSAIRFQRKCVRLQAELVSMRVALNQPLGAADAELQELRDAISRNWNIQGRLDRFESELDWLQRSAQTAEQLRIFSASRWAAGAAFVFLVADSLQGPLSSFLAPYFPSQKDGLPLYVFGGAAILAWVALIFLSNILRRPVAKQDRDTRQ